MSTITRTYLCRLLILGIVHTRALTLLLGVSGITLGLGFIFANTLDPNYSAAVDFASPIYWAIGLLVYGSVKVLQSLGRMPALIKLLNALQGAWIWTFLFISFSVLDFAPITPTELLLLVPIFCEMWELAVAIFNFKVYQRRRKEDTK